MKLHSQLTLRPDFLYLAPLLNVVLLLLIFFLLNSNLVVRSGYRVQLPPGNSSLKPLERAHLVTITGGEIPRVLLNGNEVQTGDLQAALTALKDESREVLLNADLAAPNGLVNKVQNAVFAAGCGLSIAQDPVQ